MKRFNLVFRLVRLDLCVLIKKLKNFTVTDYNCFLETHEVCGYFKYSNLKFYKVSMTSAENDTFISHLKRSNKNGQS